MAIMTADDADQLDLRIFPDREQLGVAAAADIADELRAVLQAQRAARVIFASAPSQSETLAALAQEPGIDWSKVTAFHMDEYLGLPADAPQKFATWLRTTIFDRVPLGAVHYIDAEGLEQESADAYAALLEEAPIDIVCLGIGVNGHIAFNDPPVADFNDPALVKIVDLDEKSRVQQVQDGLFATVDDVPERAITLTVPMLMSGKRLFCMVPGELKAEALRATVNEWVSTNWPSTILRTHPRCTVYADTDAASLINQS
ncbi:glucosamine-6-phosphate deaminase [Microlunatus endophyticus]|uniref:Glucosamine-6-phosphate deaminase n=2 Tax=Microlunatus endophyticus TaxID=1716077 RepID=A0A917SCQ8_9ACTN|nr:glucosamine-6-phosphate deaminase [Microlunatus endophyticus]